MSYTQDSIVYTLANDYNIFPWLEGKYEYSELDDNEGMVNLAGGDSKSSVLIKFDKSEFQ